MTCNMYKKKTNMYLTKSEFVLTIFLLLLFFNVVSKESWTKMYNRPLPIFNKTWKNYINLSYI